MKYIDGYLLLEVLIAFTLTIVALEGAYLYFSHRTVYKKALQQRHDFLRDITQIQSGVLTDRTVRFNSLRMPHYDLYNQIIQTDSSFAESFIATKSLYEN